MLSPFKDRRQQGWEWALPNLLPVNTEVMIRAITWVMDPSPLFKALGELFFKKQTWGEIP